MIGLDGPENWEAHEDIGRHTRLVQSKIAEARASGLPIEFQVWIEKDDSVSGELPYRGRNWRAGLHMLFRF